MNTKEEYEENTRNLEIIRQLAKREKYDEAIEICNELLKKNDKELTVDVYFELANRVYAWQDKYDESLKYYNKILKIDKKNAYALEYKARILEHKNKIKSALKCYRKLFRFNNSWYVYSKDVLQYKDMKKIQYKHIYKEFKKNYY
jgi:tetratricopeptide (TPR) repeat protein